MKVQKTISIDLSTWAEAKTRTNNVSSLLSNLLSEWNKSNKSSVVDDEIRRALESKEAEISILQHKLSELETKKAEKKTASRQIFTGGV